MTAIGMIAAMMPSAFGQESDEPTAQSVLDQIIVRGQKIERSLQDTKEAITVFTAEEIEDRILLDLEDVFNQTANAFEFANGENFGIRGITQNSGSTGGGSGQLGSLYIDGVAYTGFATRFGPKDLWDVEQVEILKGPQSTNLGRNALIGAVVVTTKKPTDEFEAAGRVEIATFNKRSFEAMVNLPVLDNLSVRFSGEYLETDGFNENVTRDEDDYDARDNKTARAKILFEPTEWMSLLLTGQYAQTNRGQDIFRGDLQPLESRNSSANLNAFEDYEARNAALDVSVDLFDNLSVRSITSVIDGTYDRFDDDDEGPEGFDAFRGRHVEDNNWAEELRFNYTSDWLDGALGGYYTQVDLINNTRGLTNIDPTLVGLPGSLVPFYPALLQVQSDRPFEQETTNKAFFTEWDLHLSDQWTVSAGVRYEFEEQTISSNTSTTLLNIAELPNPAVFPSPPFPPILGPSIAATNAFILSQLSATAFPSETTDYSAWLPHGGVTFNVNDDLSISAFYKRGYRAGGVELNLIGVRSDFDPEFLDNYEVALRSVWLDGRLIANANAYYGDWKDQQVTFCPTASTFNCVITNAGESEIYGVEFDTQFFMNDSTSFFLSLGYANTEFKNFVSGLFGDLGGNEFASSPNVNLAIGGKHFFDEHLYMSGNVSYQDSHFADTRNDFTLDPRLLVNFKAGWENENFGFVFYGTNLTDDLYRTVNGIGLNNSSVVRVGAPREIGGMITAKF